MVVGLEDVFVQHLDVQQAVDVAHRGDRDAGRRRGERAGRDKRGARFSGGAARLRRDAAAAPPRYLLRGGLRLHGGEVEPRDGALRFRFAGQEPVERKGQLVALNVLPVEACDRDQKARGARLRIVADA